MKILIAPDSFKESLTAKEVALSIEKGIRRVIPDAVTVILPMADGGEGTVRSLADATGGDINYLEVHDPLMHPTQSYYGILGDRQTACIESATAIGLSLTDPADREPMITSSYGVGDLIKHALNKGCTKFIIGIGGTATNDGGAGCFSALGGRLLDFDGKVLGAGGGNLGKLVTIDDSGLDKRLKNCEIRVACDVKNPLCGPDGASYVYGPQKGATPQMTKILDDNLRHFGKILEKFTGRPIIDTPGAGAAGGMGAGLMALMNARLMPGFDIVADITGLDKHIKQCDMVITGEGKIDFQTQFGKTPFGVAQRAKKAGKPVLAFCGLLGENTDFLFENGFTSIIPICREGISLKESIENAELLLEQAAEKIIRKFLEANRIV
jgi:glycerate 2-kinase